MAHDVFISHSNQDKMVASAICSRLEQAGIRCWIAPRDVRPGRNWGSEIIRGLDSAKVMIVVLSANANDSPPVMNEVERAFHKRIAIIPVRTEDVMPSEALEYFLSPKHWLDAFNPPIEAHIDRLARTVEEYLLEQIGATSAAASSAAPPATAEQLSKEDADETRRTDAASPPSPSEVEELPLAIAESAREKAASIKEVTERTERKDAPLPQMEPPARPIEGPAAGIEGPASRAKIGDARHRAPSRFARTSAAVQALLRLLGGSRILAACAGLAILAVVLVVVLMQRQTKSFVNGLGMKFVAVPGTNVLFSVWETRVKDYQAFCDATGRSWEKPTFSQTDEHPAVNVSWEDAKAFCEWLSEKEGKVYRLPTDHEWSCAVGIGDQENAGATPKSKDMRIADVFPWGKQWPPPNDAGNYFGEECKTAAGLAELKAAGYDVSSWPAIEGFNDGKVLTAAAGSFRPNGVGIYDLGGNVWERCQDEYEPGSGSRVLRGGSWGDETRDYALRDYALSSFRGYDPGFRRGRVGFRTVVKAGSGAWR